jgi:hypothetical protein
MEETENREFVFLDSCRPERFCGTEEQIRPVRQVATATELMFIFLRRKIFSAEKRN